VSFLRELLLEGGDFRDTLKVVVEAMGDFSLEDCKKPTPSLRYGVGVCHIGDKQLCRHIPQL
jgi:hypothetical protein